MESVQTSLSSKQIPATKTENLLNDSQNALSSFADAAQKETWFSWLLNKFKGLLDILISFFRAKPSAGNDEAPVDSNKPEAVKNINETLSQCNDLQNLAQEPEQSSPQPLPQYDNLQPSARKEQEQSGPQSLPQDDELQNLAQEQEQSDLQSLSQDDELQNLAQEQEQPSPQPLPQYDNLQNLAQEQEQSGPQSLSQDDELQNLAQEQEQPSPQPLPQYDNLQPSARKEPEQSDLQSLSQDDNLQPSARKESKQSSPQPLPQYDNLQPPARKKPEQSAQQPIKIDGNAVSEPVERADLISSIIENDPAIKESMLSNKINIVHSSFKEVYNWIFEQITTQKVTDSTRNNYLAILNTYTAIHLFRKFEAALLDKQLCPTVDLLKHKFKSILHKKFSNQGLLNWLARVFPPELKQYIDKKKIIHRFYQFCKQAKEEIENQDSSKGIFSKWNAQVEMYNLKKSRELRLESFEDKQNHLIDLDKVNLSENIDIYTKEAGIIRMLLSRMKDENKLLLLADQLEQNQELLSDSELGLELKGEAKKIWNTAQILFVPKPVERVDSISSIIESDPAIKESLLSNEINIVHSSFEEVYSWIFEQITASKSYRFNT